MISGKLKFVLQQTALFVSVIAVNSLTKPPCQGPRPVQDAMELRSCEMDHAWHMGMSFEAAIYKALSEDPKYESACHKRRVVGCIAIAHDMTVSTYDL